MLKMTSNICPYIGLEIPLCGLSIFCVMFLGVSPVSSTLGNPQRKYNLFARRRAFTSPKNPPISTSIDNPQLYSHSLTQATLNRYSRPTIHISRKRECIIRRWHVHVYVDNYNCMCIFHQNQEYNGDAYMKMM
jgi:hypothetical protein